jgi:hypothetical protein
MAHAALAPIVPARAGVHDALAPVAPARGQAALAA